MEESKEKISEVIGISELAQSYGSIVLKEPDTARARPSSFFKTKKYDKVFSEKTPLKTYLFCAKLRKRVEGLLARWITVARDRTNMLFYCLSYIGLKMDASKLKYADADANKLSEEWFQEALSIVSQVYAKCGGDDHAARGSEMIELLKSTINQESQSAPPTA